MLILKFHAVSGDFVQNANISYFLTPTGNTALKLLKTDKLQFIKSLKTKNIDYF